MPATSPRTRRRTERLFRRATALIPPSTSVSDTVFGPLSCDDRYVTSERYQQMQPRNVHVCESQLIGLSGFEPSSALFTASLRPWLFSTVFKRSPNESSGPER